MTAGDPSVYWTQVYSEGNTRITRSPTNKYAFLEEGMKFIFFSSKEKLQEIATSDYQESCKLVSEIFNEFSTGKKITIQETVKFIQNANWYKAFD